jgi:hypothetical protein
MQQGLAILCALFLLDFPLSLSFFSIGVPPLLHHSAAAAHKIVTRFAFALKKSPLQHGRNSLP